MPQILRIQRIWRVVASAGVTLLGGVLLAYEALHNNGQSKPRGELVAAYLTMLLGPTAIHIDRRIRSVVAKAVEKVKNGESDDPDG